MDEALRTLGQRIVDAARLAAVVHLQQMGLSLETVRQQQPTGGAVLGLSRDGELSLVDDRPRRSSIVERGAG
jgi:hypothetical protein